MSILILACHGLVIRDRPTNDQYLPSNGALELIAVGQTRVGA